MSQRLKRMIGVLLVMLGTLGIPCEAVGVSSGTLISDTVPPDRMRILRGRDYFQHLKSHLRKAQERIWISTYSMSEDESGYMGVLLGALENRSDSGVDVRILLPSKLDESDTREHSLEKRGLPTRQYGGGGLLHAKFVLVDNKYVYNGSANLTLTAFTREYETTLYMESKPVAKEFDRYFRRLWKDSEP